MRQYLPYLAVAGFLCVVAIELWLCTAKRAKPSTVSGDRGTSPLIGVVVCTALALGVVAASGLPGCRFHWRGTLPVAAGLIVLGWGLRWCSVLYLGRFFTPTVAIAPDHCLIQSGPYRILRHPCYTGSMLVFLGFALGCENWASLIITVVPCLAAVLWRVHVEEAALLGALGETYRSYMQRTKRLIPLVY